MKYVTLAILIITGLSWGAHEELSIPHAPHFKAQQAIEQLLAGQHGPDVECKRICAPAGFEDEVETDLEVVTCAGNSNPELSCARQGKQCAQQHKAGCAENCRDCCQCCSI